MLHCFEFVLVHSYFIIEFFLFHDANFEVFVRLSSDAMNVVIAGRDERGGNFSSFRSRQVTY